MKILRWLCVLALAMLTAATAAAGGLYLPKGLKHVDAGAFQGDRSLQQIVAAEGTETIGSKAFADTGLTAAFLSGTVKQIADDAFDGCPSTLKIYAPRDSYAASWAADHGFTVTVYDDVAELCTLYMPDGPITLPTEGGVIRLPLNDTVDCTMTCTVDGSWMTCALEDGVLVLTVQPTRVEREHHAQVTVSCGHGHTHVYELVQPALVLTPVLQTVYDERTLAKEDVLDSFSNGLQRVLTLTMTHQNLQHMTLSLTNASGQNVTNDTLPYSGPMQDSYTFMIPKGVAAGSYRLTLCADQLDAEDGSLVRSIVQVYRLEIGRAPKEYSRMTAAYKKSPYYQNLMNVCLTGQGAYDILQVAKSQVGYHEGKMDGSGTDSSNVTEFNNMMGYGNTAWCAAFVSWCATLSESKPISKSIKANPGMLLTSASAGHIYSFRTYEETKGTSSTDISFMNSSSRCTYVSRSSFKPQMGDLIIIGHPPASILAHVGIVSHVSGGRVYYYDGNGEDMDQVKLSNRALTDEAISMYGRPNY